MLLHAAYSMLCFSIFQLIVLIYSLQFVATKPLKCSNYPARNIKPTNSVTEEDVISRYI